MEIKKVFSHFIATSETPFESVFEEFSAFVQYLEQKLEDGTISSSDPTMSGAD